MMMDQSGVEESNDGWGELGVSEGLHRVWGWFMQGCSKWYLLLRSTSYDIAILAHIHVWAVRECHGYLTHLA